MGRIFITFLLGYALCQVPGGAAADRWGVRRTLRLVQWLWVTFAVALTLVGVGPFAAGDLALAGMEKRWLSLIPMTSACGTK